MSQKGSYGDPDLMIKLTKFRMPFGKHSEMLLTELPLAYLTWFSRVGFPTGELGKLMQIVYDIKSGDMEHLFDGIRKQQAQLVTESNNSTK